MLRLTGAAVSAQLKKKPWQILILVLFMAAVLAALAVKPSAAPLSDTPRGDSQDRTLSPYFAVITEDPQTDPMPLKSSRADVRIAGTVAEVKITQVYRNTGKKTLEAIYVFPASTRAAVHAMRMTIGERVVEAQIMERQQARETYEQAKKEGKTTSLLEQQRPNVFQMNVANILPGDEIVVELRYMELLQPQDNVYEFVLPTVVGPRYSNMAAQGAPDTERWVQNPYLKEGQPPPYTYGLTVEVNTGVPMVKLASPSHEVDIQYSGQNRAQVKVKNEATAGNKDFVLRYALAGDRIETGLLLYPGPEENFFLLMMEPPGRVKTDAVVPREYIFIVDVSGSMNGFPLEISKALINDIINGLNPQDFFNVLLFESDNAVLSPSGSLPATPENKKKAQDAIRVVPGGGGTQILAAFRRALALPRTPGTSRTVVVATDGYVHVEPQVFELIRQNLGSANLFPFGIGTSVNRHIIEGMARAGLGEPFIVLNPGEAPRQAARFRNYINNPVLTNITVSYEGFGAYDAEPAAVPDLFALRPLAILGKYRGQPTGAIVVRGKTAQGPFERRIQVEPAQASEANSALRLLWARQRITELADLNRLSRGKDDKRIKEITALGLKYSLMTQFTSFVAVDKIKRADGQVVTVKQPLPLPEGVSDLAVGGGYGGAPGARKAKVGGPWGTIAALPPSAPPDKASGSVAESKGGPQVTPKTEEPKTATPQVKLSLQKLQVQRGLNEAAVRQALEASLSRLAACCQEAVDKGAKLPQKITLTFTVGPDGLVTGQVLPKPPLASEAFTNCLSQALQGVTFPSPGKKAGQVTVTLTLEIK
jgi:Ca-activated chloride channel family protein